MKTIILSILLLTGSWSDSAALFGKVIHVAENDTLNVRAEPNQKANKIGEIPFDGYVGIETCKKIEKSQWCKVYFLVENYYENFWKDKNIGWVNARYLQFSNHGYVIIKGKRNCAFSLKCIDDKCEVVDDDHDIDYKRTGLKTKWIQREHLKGESNFGATPDNVDGYCNKGMFIDDYLENIKEQGK